MPNTEDYSLDAYRSSEEGVRFTVPTGGDIQLVPALREDDRVFSYCRYAEEIHMPIELPEVATHSLVALPRCLDMPLRLAGQQTYALPNEWLALRPLIEQLIAIEQDHNPHWSDYHTYMTLDCSMVTPGEQQRHGGLHADGFQGERITAKTKVTRNYIVATNGGTRFFLQRFVVVDPAQFNVFHGFDMQTSGWSRPTYQTAAEGVVQFMNAYTVHESGLASRPGLRIFFRLTYDLKPFDRLGNTENAMLDYHWSMQARTTQNQVTSPDISDLDNSPYFPARAVRHTGRYQLTCPLLIGLSGKPGSGKNWLAFRLVQELRYRGFQAGKASLAQAVYGQANLIIDDCQAGMSFTELRAKYSLNDDLLAERLYQHWTGAVGDKHPHYGYHRRNQSVRQGLETLSQLRRNEDEAYWLQLMLADIQDRQLEAAVFSDLRFPNEADYLRRHDGICLRVELDETWLQATQGRNPGYKYSEASLNSPVEVALDNYSHFFTATTAQTADPEQLVAAMLQQP